MNRNTARRNVTEAVTTTAITTALLLPFPLLNCSFELEPGVAEELSWLTRACGLRAPKLGGKNGSFGGGAGGVEPGSMVLEGEGLRPGPLDMPGPGAAAPATLVGDEVAKNRL